MSNRERVSQKRSSGKGGRFAPAFCSLMGTLILLSVIAFCLPMVLPRVSDYQVYNIVSGSMEPEIPMGSMILVVPETAENVEKNDIIAFQSEGSVIAHRVRENHLVEGEFITKGDANKEEDLRPIPYEELLGRVQLHVPAVGALMELASQRTGKIYLLVYALCGVLFHLLAGSLRKR